MHALKSSLQKLITSAPVVTLKTSLLKFMVDTLTWLTVTEYLCHGYVTGIHDHMRSSFMTYHLDCSECNDFLFPFGIFKFIFRVCYCITGHPFNWRDAIYYSKKLYVIYAFLPIRYMRQQTIGILMGTKCTPLLADLFYTLMRQTSFICFIKGLLFT